MDDKIAALEAGIKMCDGKYASFILGGPSHLLVIEAARAHLEQLRRGDADKTSRCTVCGVTIPFTENYGHMQCTKHEPQV